MMKKNLLNRYAAPRIEELEPVFTSVLCGSPLSSENEGFTEQEVYTW